MGWCRLCTSPCISSLHGQCLTHATSTTHNQTRTFGQIDSWREIFIPKKTPEICKPCNYFHAHTPLQRGFLCGVGILKCGGPWSSRGGDTTLRQGSIKVLPCRRRRRGARCSPVTSVISSSEEWDAIDTDRRLQGLCAIWETFHSSRITVTNPWAKTREITRLSFINVIYRADWTEVSPPTSRGDVSKAFSRGMIYIDSRESDETLWS